MLPKNINPELCSVCKGKGWCGKPCPIIKQFPQPKIKKHFSGSSPPEIFVGRYNYPHVNAGILAPQDEYATSEYGMPEIWYERNFSIEQILTLRSRLVYGKFKTNIKQKSRFIELAKEIVMSSKPISTEVFLKKIPKQDFIIDKHIPLIGNAAEIEKARLEENPKIERKVEYLVSDNDVRATTAIIELYKSKIKVTNINKLLSAGLLGIKFQRKLVPTRWSITAVDDTLSKFLLEKIKHYQEINEFQVFHSDYLGNHYEFLLLPDKFSFEVIEAKIPGSVWNPSGPLYLAIDHENFNGRKDYASNVTGAYYANRLALVEYLERIKRQASCLVIRECRPEYYAPCGVGILREASRAAFSKKPEKFGNLNQAFNSISKRLRLPIETFIKNSWLLKEWGKQRRLNEFFK